MNGSARRVALVSLALVVTLVTAAPPAVAQCVSLTTLGSASTQDFNTLSNSGTSSTVPTGWYFAETGTNANTLYSAGTGSSNSGDTYSFGASGNAERAFGGLRSGSLISTIGACFTNNTGGTITSLDVAFTGEQWRIGVTNRGAADRIDFQYSTTATSLTTGTWSDLNTLDYSSTVTSGTAGALDGNGATNRTAVSSSITGLSLANGATIWIRWTDFDISSSDDGLAVDDFSVTPQGTAADGAPTVSSTSPTNGATGVAVDSDVSVTFSEPVDVTGAWYTIVCASSGAHTAAVSGGPSTFTLNPDTDFSAGEACTVTIVGTLVADQDANDPPNNMTADYVFSFTAAAPPVITLIHDIQGSGAAVTGAGPFTIEGIVTGDYQTQGSGQLRGFFVQEEDTDEDADPATSEGIFVFCSSCPTAVAEGQRVRVTGSASEFFNMSQISATTAGAVTVLDAGNNLALVTPTDVALPVPAGTAVNDFFEPFEGMLVRFTDTLTVAEHYELFRFGQVELYAGGRPVQFTQDNAPSVAGYSGFLDDLSRRRVILDDDANTQNGALTLANGLQAVYYPRTNGGFSIGTQGPDFFRTGDVVAGLTGVLHWSFNGLSGTDAWRIRPTAANPVSFTAANPRPASPPAVGGSIRAAGLNLLNYFTTIDTTASDDTGPCGPSGTLDCRGADSTAELDRQRARVAQVLCGLNADVYGLIELENEAPGTAVADLLGAVNGACGGAHPYAFAGPSGTIGTDAVRVAILYRTGILTPVGAALVDLDAVHHRPPTAQPFEVTDATNPAFGKRFTVVANHLRAKGCSGSSTGLNADQLDGQGCNNLRRTEQAQRTLDWINSTVLPAAGDPNANVLLLGDFNAYPQEDPITTLVGAGYSDVLTSFLGAGSYSYIFDGQIGHLDFALTSASLTPVVTGAGTWHINADESALFDYNDEIADTGEASFEEKPDGSSLAPPRTLWDAPVLARAADHDPVVVGLFAAAGVSTTITDTPDPVYAGAGLAYTVTVANGGPESATGLTLTISVPAGTTYVGTTAPAGWSCAQAAGTVTCTAATLAAATNAVFTMSVTVGAGTPAGTVLSSTAAVTQTSGETTPGDESDTEQTTVQTPPSVFATKAVSGFAYVGGPLTYTVVLTNYGSTAQADNAGDEFVDVLPASLVLVSASATSGTAVANVGTNTVAWNGAIPAGGSVAITIEARVSDTVTVGSVVSNQGTISYDGNGDLVNESSAPTDDPATGAVGDPTAITVLGGLGGLTDVPTLGGIGLGLLALLVALGGALVLGRRLA